MLASHHLLPRCAQCHALHTAGSANSDAVEFLALGEALGNAQRWSVCPALGMGGRVSICAGLGRWVRSVQLKRERAF